MLDLRVGLPTQSVLDQIHRSRLGITKLVAWKATDKAAQNLLATIRQNMAGAQLGRLGNAITATSDYRLQRRSRAIGGGDFKVSGIVYIRRSGDRTRGAINAYTNASTTIIRPRRSSLLWIPTDDIQRLIGRGRDRKRLEAGDWEKAGLDRKIGPLVRIKAKDGTPLLIVRNASLSASGKAGSAKSRTKTGKIRKGQVAAEVIVAFVGIPQTTRARRVDVRALAKKEQDRMADYVSELLRSGV